MDTLQFLKAVWPEQGPYCILTRKRRDDKSWWHHDVEATIEGAAAKALTLSKFDDVYFNLFSLKKERVWDERKKDGQGGWAVRLHSNMASCRCLFSDVDVGESKEYKTKEEARSAVKSFIARTGMPIPIIVSSGRGFHLYWPFDRSLPADSWKELAANFAKLCSQCKFYVDPTRLKDLSSVLRVVGTRHLKDPNNPLPVKAVVVGEATPVEKIIAIVESALRSTAGDGDTMLALPAAGETFGGEKPEHFGQTNPPLRDVGKACAQIKWAATHQDKVSEPQWYHGVIQPLLFTAEGVVAVHGCSSKHPGYSAEETDRKIAQIIQGKFNPTTCTKMAELFGEERCKSCWYRGNGNSSPIAAARNLPVEPKAPGEAPGEYEPMCPAPHPYTRRQDGTIYFAPIDGDAPRTICHYDLFPLMIVHVEEEKRREIKWVVKLPNSGFKTFELPATATYDTRELADVLSNNGIFENYDQVKYIRDYMSAYIKALQKHVRDSKQHQHLGWTEGYGSFIMPDRIITQGQSTPAVCSVGVQNAAAAITTKGTLAAQIKLLDFYNHDEYMAQQFLICCSAGAPMLHATEHHGVLVNLSGPSGASKSTALYASAALWGNPNGLPLNGTNDGATFRARNERQATMANLPVLVDEITHIEPAICRNMVMSVTQPGNRKRLDNKGQERKDISYQKSTFMLTTSNSSLHEILSEGNAARTAGSMRVFELPVEPQTVHDKRQADDFLRLLSQDYGHIGPALIDYYTCNRVAVANDMVKLGRELDAKHGVGPEERFWSDAIQTAVVACRVGNKLGLIPFDAEKLYAWAVSVQLTGMRKVVHNSYASPIDSLMNYVATVSGDLLVTRDEGGRGSAIIREPKRNIAGRHDQTAHKMYLIHSLFKAYALRFSIPLAATLADLERKGVATVTRFTIGKGTHYDVGQSTVLCVDMSHPMISGRTTQPAEETSNVVSIKTGTR